MEEKKGNESEEIMKAPVQDESKEIPEDVTEKSEGWSKWEGQEEREREGGKEKENSDEWEGNCFGWRCREAEYGGCDEMAGDWVVMY